MCALSSGSVFLGVAGVMSEAKTFGGSEILSFFVSGAYQEDEEVG